MFKHLSVVTALAVFAAVFWRHALADTEIKVSATGDNPFESIKEAIGGGSKGSSEVIVSATATGANTFKTIREAIASAPKGNTPFVINIKKGTYRERLTITRPNIHLKGEGRALTIIAANIAAGTKKPDGSIWGTIGAYVLKVDTTDFIASSLTIRNNFDYMGNAAKKSDDPTKMRDTQALALYIGERSDRAYFSDVSFISYHDTMYINGGKSYFERCRITGNVDFIFGNGLALFDSCDLVARPPKGFLTAPSTDIKQKYGFVFKNCKVVKESAKVPSKSFALGRPWHPYAPKSRNEDPNAIGMSVFINTRMDDVIYGWDKMPRTDTKGYWLPEDSRFFEYQSTGAGAAKGAGRRQLTAQQAAQYSKENILAGWTPTLPGGAGD